MSVLSEYFTTLFVNIAMDGFFNESQFNPINELFPYSQGPCALYWAVKQKDNYFLLNKRIYPPKNERYVKDQRTVHREIEQDEAKHLYW